MAKKVKVVYEKSALKRKLKSGKCHIIFNKITTGDVREMIGTLNEDEIPAKNLPKGTGTREPVGVIRVFDTQKKAWRSFHVSEVREFNRVVA